MQLGIVIRTSSLPSTLLFATIVCLYLLLTVELCLFMCGRSLSSLSWLFLGMCKQLTL
jgi:hypothetical protein